MNDPLVKEEQKLPNVGSTAQYIENLLKNYSKISIQELECIF